jgi:SAM-dependent methyltransferase
MIDPLFAEWRAYQKLVENDYMGHAQFFQCLLAETRDRFHKPMAILDLGCGDSMPVQALLQHIRVKQYCGVDQSETALAQADALLANSGLSYRLLAGDILKTAQQIEESFDLIIASFSLHHLQGPARKKVMLQACHQSLNPGGVLAIIDVFLGDSESRDGYVDRFEQQAKKNYDDLNDSEMTTLITHVRECDYPESMKTYRELGLQAGFGQVRELLRDDSSLHQLVLLETG